MACSWLPVALSSLTVALTVLLQSILLHRWIPGLLTLHSLRAILRLLLPIVLLITATLLLAVVVVARGLVVRLHAVHT